MVLRVIWNMEVIYRIQNFFPNNIKLKLKPSYKYDTRLLQDWSQSHGNWWFNGMWMQAFHTWVSWISTQKDMEIKLHSNKSYFFSQHPQTHRISLIQIWYKTTSRLKPNPWRLVIHWHEYARFSFMYLWYLDLKIMWT